MIAGEPSQTALHVAAARAAHRRFDPPPHLLEDPHAESLLGDRAEALIQSYADGGSWLLTENRLSIPLRARYVEDRLAAAYRNGVRQLVVLGAGLDSYPFRTPTGHSELRIYEVDHPSTQQWKTTRIRELAWTIPESLDFIACDFEQTSVPEALRGSSFDADRPTIVSWMGVTYYLTPETTCRTLTDLHGILAPGSEVVFDYQFPYEDLSERYRGVSEAMNYYLKAVGEPQHNRYRREALAAVIRKAGYDEVLLESRTAIHERYYTPLGTRIPMSERFGLAVAKRGSHAIR